MSLADAVHEVGSDGAEHVAVDGAEGAALEVPHAGVVVRERGVRVLEVGDHDKPVVAVDAQGGPKESARFQGRSRRRRKEGPRELTQRGKE